MSHIVRFRKIEPDAMQPRRGDRSLDGILPTRATRYCEAVTTANAYGWQIGPARSLQVQWTGSEVVWRPDRWQTWRSLDVIQSPSARAEFDRHAPDALKNSCIPLCNVLPEPGLIQIWSGYLAETKEGWSLLTRGLVNKRERGQYQIYEGIVDTDRRFGPVFVNIQLIRTGETIEFSAETPLFLVQPVPREAFADETLNSPVIQSVAEWTADDWRAYATTNVNPGLDSNRKPGVYAAEARRRRKGGCPVHHSGEAA